MKTKNLKNQTQQQTVITVRPYTVTAQPNISFFAVFKDDMRISRAFRTEAAAKDRATEIASHGFYVSYEGRP